VFILIYHSCYFFLSDESKKALKAQHLPYLKKSFPRSYKIWRDKNIFVPLQPTLLYGGRTSFVKNMQKVTENFAGIPASCGETNSGKGISLL
jgi:hypothetical protein